MATWQELDVHRSLRGEGRGGPRDRPIIYVHRSLRGEGEEAHVIGL